MTKYLITGANGFAGRHVCKYLCKHVSNSEIVGIDVNEDSLGVKDYDVLIGNVLDYDFINKVIREVKPDTIIHLAGIIQSIYFTEVYKVCLISTWNILESVRNVNPEVLVISTGSSAEYGRIDMKSLPIIESSICNPITTNGIGKYMATLMLQNYTNIYALRTMIVRPFQLIGKGISEKLVPGAFYKEICLAKESNVSEIKVGNLNSYRDFVDIEDFAEALYQLSRSPRSGEIFNICSGVPVKILDLLTMMIKKSGKDFQIVADPTKLKREADIDMIYGSFEKIRNRCNWEPKTNLEQSIEKLFLDC